MPPRMTTRSAGCATATPRGGRIGGRTGRGGGRARGRSGDQGNGRIDGQGGQAQVGNQGSNQGNPRNQNGDAINDNIQGDVRNVIVNNNRRGCTYKEFLACNPKEYDGKGEAAVGMSWENFKNLTREEFCPVNEMQKLDTEFWNHAMVGADHAAYTNRFHELARLVPHLVTPQNKRIERYIYGLAPQIRRMVPATEPTIIQKAMQKYGTLTDESIRNGSLKKNTEKRGSGGEPSRYRNVKDDNKRSRTGNAFATTANPVKREYTGMTPKMVNPVNARNPTAAHGACFECGSTDYFKVACPRLNQAQRLGETIQTKLWLIMGDKVVETTTTKHVERHLC
ncbi:reverse transcriptase domain-containing protein [Tanacetum coccineum]